MPRSNDFFIVFSDLDGTLLDHDTYGFSAAINGVRRLEQEGIPLVLNSSKTLSEMVSLKKKLCNTHPFICENGSVVAVPQRYFPDAALERLSFEKTDDLWISRPGGNLKDLLPLLHDLRGKKGFSFEGFSDMDVDRLAELTGLGPGQAAEAKKRLSTEPILWQGTKAEWQDFCLDLERLHLAWVQGGRFISVSRPFDKKDGMDILIRLYREAAQKHPGILCFGDSPNDQTMLNVADIAVIVKSHRSCDIRLMGPATVIRTEERGPEGWQTALDHLLDEGQVHGSFTPHP